MKSFIKNEEKLAEDHRTDDYSSDPEYLEDLEKKIVAARSFSIIGLVGDFGDKSQRAVGLDRTSHKHANF